MSTHPLHGNGIAYNLFHYLKPRLDEKPLNFKIPDTIVFRNFPITWYYWAAVHSPELDRVIDPLGSRDRKSAKVQPSHDHSIYGEVREKAGQHLEKANIMKTFASLQKSPHCDIIASFTERNPDDTYSVQYLSTDELTAFLNEQHTGILQSFVLPRTEHNDAIQAVWSTNVCHVNKRINRYKLHDKGRLRHEKAITYEGSSAFSEEAKIAEVAQNKVKKVCESIVNHIASADHHYAISHMVLHFKEDRNESNLLWLLYSTSCCIVEVRYGGPQKLLSFGPKFRLSANQEKHTEIAPILERAEISKLRASKAPSEQVMHFIKGMPAADKELLGSVILHALEEDATHRSHTTFISPLHPTKKNSEKPSKLAASLHSLPNSPMLPRTSLDEIKSPISTASLGEFSTSSFSRRTRNSTSPHNSEGHLAGELFFRESQRLQHRFVQQRLEADSVVAKAERQHRSTMGRQPTHASAFDRMILARHQAQNQKLWDQIQGLQGSLDQLQLTNVEAEGARLKARHRPPSPPLQKPLPALEESKFSATDRSDRLPPTVSAIGTPELVRSLPSFPAKVSNRSKASSRTGQICLTPKSVVTECQTIDPKEQEDINRIFQIVSQSIKMSFQELRRDQLLLLDELDDQLDWATSGLMSTSAQIVWPDPRLVYETIWVAPSLHAILQCEGIKGSIMQYLKPANEFWKAQQAKKVGLDVAKFPNVNIAVNVNPVRDPWYGEELMKKKPAEHKIAPIPHRLSATSTPPSVRGEVGAATIDDSSQGFVQYCLAFPDKKEGHGTIAALKKYIRTAVLKLHTEEETHMLADLLKHIHNTRKLHQSIGMVET